MSTPNTTPCSRCSAPIPPEDFKQGLAVRVQGQPVCKVCVDGGESQTPAPQRIPLMQQNIYRFTHAEHDNLNRFTFLTAGHIALHRRVDREQGQFDPPELPTTESDAETVALQSDSRTRTTKRDVRGNQDQEKESNNSVLIAVGASVALIVILFLIMSGGDTTDTNQNSQATQTPISKNKVRSDFPEDPIAAWSAAKKILKNDNTLLAQISEEVQVKIAKRLDKVQTYLDQKDSTKALELLNKISIPREQQFNDLYLRKKNLTEERNLLIAGTNDTPNNTDPEPEPEPIDNTPPPLVFERIFKLSSNPNTDGLLIDETDHGHDATTHNITASSIGENPAIKFGDSSYIKIDDGISYPHSFFLNFWFKINDSSGNSFQWLYCHAEKNTKGSINIYFSESDALDKPLTLRSVIAYNEVNTLNVSTDTINIFDGKWHNYALLISHEKGAMVLIDGELLAQNIKIKGPLLPNAPLIIGARHDRKKTFRGEIAQIQCYQGVSDIETISANITKQLPDYQKGPEIATVPDKGSEKTPASAAIDDTELGSIFELESWVKHSPAKPNEPVWCKSMDIGDIDNDGDTDLIFGSTGACYITINDGKGNFDEVVTYNKNKSQVIGTVCKDMNGDDLLDIIHIHENDTFFVFINKGDKTFNKSSPARTSFEKPMALLVEDFNGDGFNDVLIGQGKGLAHQLFLNDGSGDNINSWAVSDVGAPLQSVVCKSIDYDNDGDIDIIEAIGRNGVHLLKNKGDGTFERLGPIADTTKKPVKHLAPYAHSDSKSFLIGSLGQLFIYTQSEEGFKLDKQIDGKLASRLILHTENISGTGDQEIFYVQNNTFSIADYQGTFKALDTIIGCHSIHSADLNGDSYYDIILGCNGQKNPTQVYLRKTDDMPTSIPSTINTEPETTDPELDAEKAPMPIILSRFVGSGYKHKSINVYDEKIEGNTDIPKFLGNTVENNYPMAMKSRYKSKKNEMTLKLDANNAANGGILITLHPYDDKRTSVDISLKDGANNELDPVSFKLDGAKWQTLALDLSQVPDDFDAGNLSEITLRDTTSGNSINFLLYRLCFYKDYVPSIESLPSAEQLVMNKDIGPLQFKYKRIMPKRPNLDDTIILLDQSIMSNKSFSLDLRKAFAPLLGKTIGTGQCLSYHAYDNKWLNDKYVKGILRKNKPSFVIVIGVGNEMQDGAKPDTSSFWKAFCSATYQKGAMPILIAGPDINVDNNTDTLWSFLTSDQFLTHKLFEPIPLINMQGDYMKDSKFNRGKRTQAIEDITRSIHDVFSRVREMPPR